MSGSNDPEAHVVDSLVAKPNTLRSAILVGLFMNKDAAKRRRGSGDWFW
jgi:hypothetical protein